MVFKPRVYVFVKLRFGVNMRMLLNVIGMLSCYFAGLVQVLIVVVAELSWYLLSKLLLPTTPGNKTDLVPTIKEQSWSASVCLKIRTRKHQSMCIVESSRSTKKHTSQRHHCFIRQLQLDCQPDTPTDEWRIDRHDDQEMNQIAQYKPCNQTRTADKRENWKGKICVTFVTHILKWYSSSSSSLNTLMPC